MFAPTERILEEIRGSGFTVTRLKETVLSREMAEEFYREHREKPFFSQLVEFMCRSVSSPDGCKRRARARPPSLNLPFLTVISARGLREPQKSGR